jgi:hypothetical protein
MKVEAPAMLFSIMLVVGTAITGIAVLLLVLREFKAVPPGGEMTAAPRKPFSRWALIGLALIVGSGLLLRFEAIEQRGMSHPEVYVPNIRLPEGISEPPPRTDFITTVWWHFHDEPQPVGYYFFMFAWTKLFGTSLVALRLPSVLFGSASILLLFLLVRRIAGEKTALLAAAFIAFNGHQIYWSVQARMFTMALFIGLLSTLLMLGILTNDGHAPCWKCST